LALGLLGVPLALAMPIVAQGQSDEELAKQMVNNADPSTYNVYGLPKKPKSVKDESVQGGRSLKVPVTGSGNPWDIGVMVPITKPIHAGDKIQMMFYAKLDKPEAGVTSAKTGAGIQLATAPYSSFMTQMFDITPEWKLFTLAGTADKDYPVGSLNASFQPNTGKHVFALGIVAVFDKGQ
jgi:hypothetical protein